MGDPIFAIAKAKSSQYGAAMTSEPSISAAKVKALPDSLRGEWRALLALGIPMAATQFIQFSIYMVDTLMLGRVGKEDLAAAALGSVIYFALWMLGSGPVMAVSPMVSQALGADTSDRIGPRRSVRMVLWIIFASLPVMVLCMMFTETLALKFGQNPIVAAKAQDYVLTLAIGLPFAMGVMALRNFLAALEKTFVPLLLVTSAIGINIFLNWLLIFGVGPFPRLELVGAGIASSISYILTFAFFVIYIGIDKKAREFDLFRRVWVPDFSKLKEALKLGGPMSMTTFFEGMLFNVAVLIVGVIGVAEQAAYQIALNVAAAAFMLPWGMSMAGAVRMGLARGANNAPAEKRVANTTMIASVLAIGLIALPVTLLPNEIAGLYMNIEKPENRDVIALVVMFLPLAAAFMFFDAVQVAANQLLRGLKDVNVPMVITLISYWIIGFPIAYGLGLHTEIGAIGVWYGLTAGLIAASIGLGIRLLWQLKHRPVLTPDLGSEPHQI